MTNRIQVKNLTIIIGIALISVLAVFFGNKRNNLIQKDLISNSIKELNVESKLINPNKWAFINPLTDSKEGYIYIGDAMGYNGLIKMLVLSDTSRVIRSVKVIDQAETHSYFQRIIKKEFLKSFIGKDINSINNIDGISSATISSNGIKNAIISAYHLGDNLDPNEKEKLKFGTLEFIILLLFVLAFANAKIRRNKYKKRIWWTSLLLSVIFLGFIYNQSITTARINSLLLGTWPSIYTGLFVYILLFGTLLSILFTGKNHYCHSICPFGASQEIIGKLGNAKPVKFKFSKHLKKMQWLISFLVITVGLYMHDPSLTEYEVYGGLFNLTASKLGFVLVILIIISSLFIKRPWCRFLCPLDGVFKYLRVIRKEAIRIFKK